MPFQAEFGYSLPPRLYSSRPERDISNAIRDIEAWAALVNKVHTSKIDISAKRLGSALAHRNDPTDALIDAVMVWENLVGTSTEVSLARYGCA